MKFELRQQFRIESARFLPNLPGSHPCRQMHGHSFRITLILIGEQDPKIGWVRDYHEINQTAQSILSKLDHKVLNEVPGLQNPSSENLCLWLFQSLSPLLPELRRVVVSETPDTECIYPANDT